MSLIHETNTKAVGYKIGDMKMVTYNISFTLNELVEPENGWLLLNGATIDSTYPILLARFGSTLPDLTDGVVPVPKGLTNFTSWGATGGEINHTLSSGELAIHSHPDTFSFTVASHLHTNSSSSISSAGSNHYHDNDLVALGGGAGSGGGLSGDSPNAVSGVASADNTGHGHTALPSVPNNTSLPTANIGGSIGSTGSGGSHNNMQPYLVMGGWLVRAG